MFSFLSFVASTLSTPHPHMRTHRHVGRKRGLSAGCGLHVYDSREINIVRTGSFEELERGARLWQFEIGGNTLKLIKQSRLLAGDTLQRANTGQTRFHARMYEQK